jgi:hypothetical protein
VANKKIRDFELVRLNSQLTQLNRLKAELQARMDSGTPPAFDEARDIMEQIQTTIPAKIALVEAKLKDLRNIGSRVRGDSTPRGYLLGLDLRGNGKAIVAIGNPDDADNLATYVPGTGTALNGGIEGDLERALRMARDAQDYSNARTVTVMWLGYDAPQSILGMPGWDGDSNTDSSAMNPDQAKAGAIELRRFQTGLRLTHLAGWRARHTVVGHSYGTTVIGYAAKVELDADHLIFMGSPGVGVSHANDLHLTGYASSEGRVWAGTALGDMIQHAPEWDWQNAASLPLTTIWDTQMENLILGKNPTHGGATIFGFGGFGARVIACDPSLGIDPRDAHSSYWNEGNIARDNMAWIIIGHQDRVVLDLREN